jgi:hypothetical protein
MYVIQLGYSIFEEPNNEKWFKKISLKVSQQARQQFCSPFKHEQTISLESYKKFPNLTIFSKPGRYTDMPTKIVY